MGTRFFKIVGIFSYGCAALAITATILLALTATVQNSTSVDTTIRITPYTVDDYRADKAEAGNEQKSLANTNANSIPSHEDLEAEAHRKEVQTVFDSIVAKLDAYGNATSQGGTNPEGLSNYLNKIMEGLPDDQPLKFLYALEEALTGLNAQSLSKPHSGQIQWNEFLQKFSINYVDQINAEQERISDEQLATMAAKAESTIYLYAAGVAFVVFIFFTLILLLVKIESNTRATTERISELIRHSENIAKATNYSAAVTKKKLQSNKPPSTN